MPRHLLMMSEAPDCGGSAWRGAGRCAEGRMMGSGAGGRWRTLNMGLEGTARGRTMTCAVWIGEGRGLLEEGE